MASTEEDTRAAAQKVYDFPELQETILLQQDPKDILDHLHYDAPLIETVQGSVALQRKLWLREKSDVAVPSQTASSVQVGSI